MTVIRHAIDLCSSTIVVVVLAFGTGTATSIQAAEPIALVPTGKLEHESICEASGLAASRTHPGLFWTLNDSGNLARIYAVDRTGKLLAEYALREALNIDWESLALADGKLYVGDVGNNFGAHGLAYRWIYECDEPDPWAANPKTEDPQAEESHPLRALDIKRTLIYSFPDRAFDVEAMFCHRQALYLVSKVTGNATAGLYRLPLPTADQPKIADKPVKLVEVCRLSRLPQVTGADISADGTRLALCSYAYAVEFQLKPDVDWSTLDQQPRKVMTFRRTGIEACAYDGEHLLMFSEDRRVYRMKLGAKE